MGTEGAISIDDDDLNSESDKRKFPAFRFPESAVNALGRIVKYVEYKKKPAGKLVWYKDVKAGEARNLVQNELSKIDTQQPVLKLNRDSSIKLLSYFGIDFTETRRGDSQLITIRVKSDPLFGPLIEVVSPESKSALRITPLTDYDLDEILTELNLKESKGVSEMLGRLSQMIEDIPWLWEFETKVAAVNEPLAVGDILINIKPGGVERPSY